VNLQPELLSTLLDLSISPLARSISLKDLTGVRSSVVSASGVTLAPKSRCPGLPHEYSWSAVHRKGRHIGRAVEGACGASASNQQLEGGSGPRCGVGKLLGGRLDLGGLGGGLCLAALGHGHEGTNNDADSENAEGTDSDADNRASA
jgi:hypothetical protein